MDYRKELERVKQRGKIDAVAKGVVKKRTLANKFADIFFAEEVGDVGHYIFVNAIVPNIKRILSQSVNTLLYGKSAPDNRGGGYFGDRPSYRTYFNDERPSRRAQSPSYENRRVYHWDDISYRDDTFDGPEAKTGYQKAEQVLNHLCDDIREYGMTTVQWLYEYSDLQAPWTAEKYGWTNINSADIVEVGNGEYVIKLPKPLPLT